MELPWGFNETTIREMSRVALDTTYAPDGPGVRCLLRTKIPLLRYRLIGPCIYICVYTYIYIGIRCSFGGGGTIP